MSGWAAALAWLGLLVGVAVLLVVLTLLQRVLQPLRECMRYADDILDAGLGIAKNLDPADDLVRSRDLAVAVPGLAVAFLERAAP